VQAADVTEAGANQVKQNMVRRAIAELARQVLVFGAVGLSVAACGSSGGQSNPPLPLVDVAVDSQLVDVGQQYRLDASGSYDPQNKGDLDYFWTLLLPPGSKTAIQDHCDDDFNEICTRNYDACAGDATQICTTNADCDGVDCIENLATTSPDCTTGQCNVNEGAKSAVMTFVADTPGPYAARVLVSTSNANNTGSVQLNTYPSLFVLGSLFAFGGTEGHLVAQYAEPDIYAQGAASIAAQPVLGNLLLAIPKQGDQPGRVLEFSSRDGRYKGLFGDTSNFVFSPIAMTFDENTRLFVANSGGRVQIFDDLGRFIRELGTVAQGLEEVAAIAISPVTGELLVVDGRSGEPVRRYDVATGDALGTLGNIETVANTPIDLAFFGDPVTDLFVADAAGALVRCDPDGTACADVAPASGFLASGGPTSLAINPAADETDADVLVADAVNKAVIACSADGTSCSVFGDTQDLDSQYLDLTFAPPAVPVVEPPPMITTTTLGATTTTVP